VAGIADGLGRDTELLQDGGSNALGEQASQEVMGPDLGAPVRLSLPLGLIQACPQPRPQLRSERRLDTVGEAFPGGLFADAQPVANRGPGLSTLACLTDKVIGHPVCLNRQRVAERDGLVEPQ
jgi:hypothetical protein